MTNLLSRLAMAFLLATSCFLVTGCGDGAATPDKSDTEASADADGSDAKADGSAAKEDGSDSK